MANLLLLLSCILVLVQALPGAMVPAGGVTFHVTNKCPFPVWPATAPNSGHPVLAGGGFFLPPGQSKRVNAPSSWNGRFWGRTGCSSFNGVATSSSSSRCLTGDCEGRLACNGSVGTPPATLVEVSLHEEGTMSSFDVSVVDGYNLPVAVWSRPANRSGKCFVAGCAKDVNAVCPPELQVLATTPGKDKAPTVVACRSACLAFGLDAFCCRGAYGTAEACKGSVYSRLFRDACPDYYSYAYDAAAPTARCYAQEYVLTFCPSRWGAADPDPVAQV